MTDPSQDGDDVGYKKPPRHSQFKPGQSGNPKGRPKNARGLKTDLRAELVSKMKIRMNGQDVSGTKQQLMLRTLSARAASGDVRATRIILDLVMQVFGPEDHLTGPKRLSVQDQQILDQILARQIAPASAKAETAVAPSDEPSLSPPKNSGADDAAEAPTHNSIQKGR